MGQERNRPRVRGLCAKSALVIRSTPSPLCVTLSPQHRHSGQCKHQQRRPGDASPQGYLAPGMPCHGGVSPQGCLTSGMLCLGDASPQGMLRLGDASPQGCFATGVPCHRGASPWGHIATGVPRPEEFGEGYPEASCQISNRNPKSCKINDSQVGA